MKLFIDDHAWIIVPSTLKWSDDKSRFTRGCAISVTRKTSGHIAVVQAVAVLRERGGTHTG